MILVAVDDREANRFLLEEALGGMGFEIVCAASGEEALPLVERLRPEVVLLDWQMPGMDGAETSRLIKDRWPSTYVLVVSGFHEAKESSGLEKSGADAYLGKPFTLEDLRAAVRKGFATAARSAR
jgi:CheY-like chemotaxis protein